MKKDSPTKSTTSKLKRNRILVLKLITGEEIIANTNESRDKFTVNEPYLIVKDYRTESTLYQIDRWMPYVESTSLVIEKRSIITYNEPTTALNQFYDYVKKAESEPDVTTQYHSGQIHWAEASLR